MTDPERSSRLRRLMPVDLEHRFPLSPESLAEARRSLDALEGCLQPGVLEDLRLMISELVTNVIRHSGLGEDAWAGVEVSIFAEFVRGEVSEPGRGFEVPTISAPVTGQLDGRGLYLVEQLADRWDVANDGGDIFYVWFEIDLVPYAYVPQRSTE